MPRNYPLSTLGHRPMLRSPPSSLRRATRATAVGVRPPRSIATLTRTAVAVVGRIVFSFRLRFPHDQTFLRRWTPADSLSPPPACASRRAADGACRPEGARISSTYPLKRGTGPDGLSISQETHRKCPRLMAKGAERPRRAGGGLRSRVQSRGSRGWRSTRRATRGSPAATPQNSRALSRKVDVRYW